MWKGRRAGDGGDPGEEELVRSRTLLGQAVGLGVRVPVFHIGGLGLIASSGFRLQLPDATELSSQLLALAAPDLAIGGLGK